MLRSKSFSGVRRFRGVTGVEHILSILFLLSLVTIEAGVAYV